MYMCVIVLVFIAFFHNNGLTDHCEISTQGFLPLDKSSYWFWGFYPNKRPKDFKKSCFVCWAFIFQSIL